MDVVIVLVFISLVLVAAGLIFFTFRLKQGDFDHGERLALSPLADDDGTSGTNEADSASQTSSEEQSTENPEGGTLHVGS